MGEAEAGKATTIRRIGELSEGAAEGINATSANHVQLVLSFRWSTGFELLSDRST